MAGVARAMAVALVLALGVGTAVAWPQETVPTTTPATTTAAGPAVVDPGTDLPTTVEQLPENPGGVAPDEEGKPSAEALRKDGYGSAQDLPLGAKRDEIRRVQQACRGPDFALSQMLGISGSVGSDDAGLDEALLIIAGAAFLIAAGAYLLRRRHAAAGAAKEPRGPLETAATIVAVIGGVAGLAAQFVPGIGVDDPPPARAIMEVREVNARITRDEYLDKTGSTERVAAIDRREVGNVVWLEVQLTGFQDKRPSVVYGLHDLDAGGALIPKTRGEVPLRTSGKAVETLFVPIWIGYPKSRIFEVQFRLLDDGKVQGMASTGPMRGSKYRYACKRPS